MVEDEEKVQIEKALPSLCRGGYRKGIEEKMVLGTEG